ncbi:phage head closure protein [Pararhizobium sp.]|uniref:phage head closure protein n=1 Tax=Pararhizobium sp. TaxID=1977563 RepID=UPI003D0F644A
MRAGNLDKTIRIDRYDTGGVDDYGTPTPGFAALATLRAQVVQSSTEEFVEHGATDQTVIIFRCRYLDGVTNADRVHFDGGYFNIKEIKEIQRRKGLELRCIRAVNQ